MSEIQIRNVSKSYGRREILKDVSMDINSGEAVAILGANGSGKSTFLKIISGCLNADAGSVMCLGRDAFKDNKVFSELVGYVPQDNSLMEEMSVMDNLKFWYCDSGRDIGEDFESGILKDFGLFEYRKMPVKKLSGGMKKRLAIACALAKNPKVLILDEPSAALDLVCKEEIKSLLLSYKKNGAIVIMSSHEAAEFEICDRWYIIEHGMLNNIPKTTDIHKIIERMR